MRRVKIERNYVVIEGHNQLMFLLERTECVVRVGARKYSKFTFQGVPGKECDVLMEEKIVEDGIMPSSVEIQISTKDGRYDGAERKRILVRSYNRASCNRLQRVAMQVQLNPDQLSFEIKDNNEILDSYTFRRLRKDLNDYNFSRVYMWHLCRYYKHLVKEHGIEDMKARADAWAATVTPSMFKTLAEANRSASRALYKESREAGWRKLTLRERKKYCVDAQWIKKEILDRKIAPQTVSDYTLMAARQSM